MTNQPTPLTRLDADWTRCTEWTAPTGRRLTPGTEMTVNGARGRWRFVEHVTTPAGAEWVSAYPVKGGVRTCRSFHPDRVKTVHTKTKGRP